MSTSSSVSTIDPSLRLTSDVLESINSLLPLMTDSELEEMISLLIPPKIPYCPHTPSPKQMEFLSLDCMEALYGGAAGGGKSDALLMAALQYIDVPGYAALLFRRTHTDVLMPNAIGARSIDWLRPHGIKWNASLLCWTFPSGAKIQFGYMDSPMDRYRYQSSEFQLIGFDELTQFREEDYLYLFSRLRKTESVNVPCRMRSASNPGGIGHDWVKARFITQPEDRVFIPARLNDNPHLDKESYTQSLMRLTPNERDRLLNGDWDATDDRLINYDDLVACAFDSMPPAQRVERFIGVDIGRTKDLSVIWSWDLIGDIAWCSECYTMRGVGYREQFEEVARRITPQVVRLHIDRGGIGNQLAEELKQFSPAKVEEVQLTSQRMGQLGQQLAVGLAERQVRIPNDTEVFTDFRQIRKVDLSGSTPVLSTDRDKSGHGDRFWAAALGYWPLYDRWVQRKSRPATAAPITRIPNWR